MWTRSAVVAAAVLTLAPGQAVLADTVNLGSARDSTLYSDNAAFSNGAGEYSFAGSTATASTVRRAVIAFDVASAIPAGSTIDSVSLTLHVSRSSFQNPNSQPVALHRLSADWGEGTSDAGDPGGGGFPADTNDATWTHRVWPTTTWTTAGGDFSATASATTIVAHTNNGFATWSSTPALVADVQGWLNSPATNFGWILIGNETATRTARRFDTKENVTVSERPVLTVNYTPPAAGAGAVPNNDDVAGTPLRLNKSGSMITLSWGASCLASDTDYAIYEGIQGSFTTHVPAFCSTAGNTSFTFAPMLSSAYYLVVPRKVSVEGSYGKNSAGAERPASGSACATQMIVSCP